MAEIDYNKYEKLVLKYSYNGAIWAPVIPLQYKKGEIIEANSFDCGYIEPFYRWISTGNFLCINQSKYDEEKQQITYDNGITWVDTGEVRSGSLIEKNSYDCDYGVTWVPVDYEYFCVESAPETRWVNTGISKCIGYYSYPEIKEQYPTEDGHWEDTGNIKLDVDAGEKTCPGTEIDVVNNNIYTSATESLSSYNDGFMFTALVNNKGKSMMFRYSLTRDTSLGVYKIVGRATDVFTGDREDQLTFMVPYTGDSSDFTRIDYGYIKYDGNFVGIKLAGTHADFYAIDTTYGETANGYEKLCSVKYFDQFYEHLGGATRNIHIFPYNSSANCSTLAMLQSNRLRCVVFRNPYNGADYERIAPCVIDLVFDVQTGGLTWDIRKIEMPKPFEYINGWNGVWNLNSNLINFTVWEGRRMFPDLPGNETLSTSKYTGKVYQFDIRLEKFTDMGITVVNSGIYEPTNLVEYTFGDNNFLVYCGQYSNYIVDLTRDIKVIDQAGFWKGYPIYTIGLPRTGVYTSQQPFYKNSRPFLTS